MYQTEEVVNSTMNDYLEDMIQDIELKSFA